MLLDMLDVEVDEASLFDGGILFVETWVHMSCGECIPSTRFVYFDGEEAFARV